MVTLEKVLHVAIKVQEEPIRHSLKYLPPTSLPPFLSPFSFFLSYSLHHHPKFASPPHSRPALLADGQSCCFQQTYLRLSAEENLNYSMEKLENLIQRKFFLYI